MYQIIGNSASVVRGILVIHILDAKNHHDPSANRILVPQVPYVAFCLMVKMCAIAPMEWAEIQQVLRDVRDTNAELTMIAALIGLALVLDVKIHVLVHVELEPIVKLKNIIQFAHATRVYSEIL